MRLGIVSPARVRRFAYTTSFPSRHRATSSGISSGGSCRSQSITTTASPREASSPAIVAIGCPNLREKRSIFTRGSSLRRSRISSSVASVQGSTLKMSSHSRSTCSITSLRRSYTLRTLSCSLYAGITMLSSPRASPCGPWVEPRAGSVALTPLPRAHDHGQAADPERQPDAVGQEPLLRPAGKTPERGVAGACYVRPHLLLQRATAEVLVTPAIALLDRPEGRIQRRAQVDVLQHLEARNGRLARHLSGGVPTHMAEEAIVVVVVARANRYDDHRPGTGAQDPEDLR